MSKSLGNVIDPLHVIDGRSQLQLQAGIEESNLAEKEKRRYTN
jgi:valyl-tRNA synthetase